MEGSCLEMEGATTSRKAKAKAKSKALARSKGGSGGDDERPGGLHLAGPPAFPF